MRTIWIWNELYVHVNTMRNWRYNGTQMRCLLNMLIWVLNSHKEIITGEGQVEYWMILRNTRFDQILEEGGRLAPQIWRIVSYILRQNAEKDNRVIRACIFIFIHFLPHRNNFWDGPLIWQALIYVSSTCKFMVCKRNYLYLHV